MPRIERRAARIFWGRRSRSLRRMAAIMTVGKVLELKGITRVAGAV